MKPIWYFTATVELATPGAVTRPGEALKEEIDARIERDPAGHFWVPGTSIAGSLRSHFLDKKDEATVRDLLGWVEDDARQPRTDAASEKVARASRIRVLGTSVALGEYGKTPVQTQQTAIDRTRHAARKATLRSGEFMPVGTRVTVYLSTESGEAAAALTELLPTWRPVLGRGRTNGFGRTTTTAVTWGTLHRTTRAGLKAWLTGGGPTWITDTIATQTLTPIDESPAPTAIDVTVTIREALMIRAGKPAKKTGERTVTKVVRRNGHPYVPATTIRGVLRSQMEFILRSAGVQVCHDTGCGSCWSCVAFGFGGNRVNGLQGRRGRIRIEDAVVTNYALHTRQRNSVDRFTGGAADLRLWSEEVIENGRFLVKIEHCPLPLRVDSAEQRAAFWAEFQALATLVWRDVNDGYVRLGGGVTTGHGRLEIAGAALDDESVRQAIEVVAGIGPRVSEVAS